MTHRDEFLKSQKILRLATLDRRGVPHIVPVWYIYKDERFYIGSSTKTKKIKNILKNSQVGFCIDVGVRSPDIIGVSGQGRAEIIIEPSRVSSIAKDILSRYFDSLDDKSAIELLADTDCIIEIMPLDYSEWSY